MNKYHGHIWGDLPDDFPTLDLEKAYRNCIDMIGEEHPSRRLMGMGLSGAAYRFRMLSEQDHMFTTSFNNVGGGPPIDDYYQQETSLFVFFIAGLSCLESFFFAMHAMASYYKPEVFGLEENQLRNVKPKAVVKCFKKKWPGSNLTLAMNKLVESNEFDEWQTLRNILSHRVVIPRQITINVREQSNNVIWQTGMAGPEFGDIQLNQLTTTTRRKWLADQLMELVKSFSLFINNQSV
ncbi:hypothetical protein [Desulfobacula toluolica]|uniref:Cthe-2314-like HEPN domain-containing protein n=1 Tax=Desulfobacula toluolica (strain DSM 7467 / Tol2) TaxID=651182 RepID=K0NQI2_DESTT|nr:hypothetical protein [Desulfobacula toluolica]CCK82418.1 uncharacterized protein TOL2_C42620 [Desulfobacula toluolica Tol2]